MTQAQMPPAPATDALTPAAVAQVETQIRQFVRRTPAVSVDRAEFGLPGGPLTFKLEQLQHSGSFKVRGAFANLILREVPAAGVAAASGGNHGAAVAYAAGVLGIPARIFVPVVSSAAKISRIRDYGAHLVVEGDTYADALALCQDYSAESGALPVHAYDQAETILGAGTLATELRRQVPDVTTVLTGIGGGGMLSGTAIVCAGEVRAVGVEPDGAPTMTAALLAGRPADAPTGSVAVDSLSPRRVGELTFSVVSRHVHCVVLVSDEEILHAQQELWDKLRIVGETGACAALAALLSGRYAPEPGESVAVVISGANTTSVDFGQ